MWSLLLHRMQQVSTADPGGRGFNFCQALVPLSQSPSVLVCNTPDSWSHQPLLVSNMSAVSAAGGHVRRVVGGRYGLGGKAFTPVMAIAVFDNLKQPQPKDKFTVGIVGM